MNARCLLAASLALTLITAPSARADADGADADGADADGAHTDKAARLTREMQRRGDSPAEIHLAVAAVHARAQRGRRALGHLKAASRLGVARSRVDLVLADLYRRQARYDAAISTLVRLLVKRPRQPHALVSLWKTLYELGLRGVAVATDTAPIREQLARNGLHLPRSLELAADAQPRSAKLSASGYAALLGGKPRLAADLFREAIDALPSNAKAHRGLGIALARQHDHKRAAGAYLLYLEITPDAPDAAEVDRALMRYWRRLSEAQP